MNAVSIALILGTFIAGSCCANDSRAPERLANLMKHSRLIESDDAGACAASRDPVSSLRLEDGHAKAVRLAYFAGCGWKYMATNRTARAKTGLQRVADGTVGSAASSAAERENPLTVYIDGPTGYVFGWTQADGWQFVGHLDSSPTG